MFCGVCDSFGMLARRTLLFSLFGIRIIKNLGGSLLSSSLRILTSLLETRTLNQLWLKSINNVEQIDDLRLCSCSFACEIRSCWNHLREGEKDLDELEAMLCYFWKCEKTLLDASFVKQSVLIHGALAWRRERNFSKNLHCFTETAV